VGGDFYFVSIGVEKFLAPSDNDFADQIGNPRHLVDQGFLEFFPIGIREAAIAEVRMPFVREKGIARFDVITRFAEPVVKREEVGQFDEKRVLQMGFVFPAPGHGENGPARKG